MSLRLVTAPAIEPITVTEAKTHCKVEVTADDQWFTDNLPAVRETAERELWRALITQSWRLSRDTFWGHGDLRVPKGELQEIDSIKYLDTTGTLQTLDPSIYVVDAESEPGRIRLGYNQIWPVTYKVPNAVQINFTCGYGAMATDIPRSIRLGMLLLLAHLYRNRESTIAGVPIVRIPDGVQRLWENYRLNDYTGPGAVVEACR